MTRRHWEKAHDLPGRLQCTVLLRPRPRRKWCGPERRTAALRCRRAGHASQWRTAHPPHVVISCARRRVRSLERMRHHVVFSPAGPATSLLRIRPVLRIFRARAAADHSAFARGAAAARCNRGTSAARAAHAHVGSKSPTPGRRRVPAPSSPSLTAAKCRHRRRRAALLAVVTSPLPGCDRHRAGFGVSERTVHAQSP